MTERDHTFHVRGSAWHYKIYQQYLEAGGKAVVDFCSYWRIILQQKRLAVKAWTEQSLDTKIKFAARLAGFTAFLAGLGFLCFESTGARFIVAALVGLGLAYYVCFVIMTLILEKPIKQVGTWGRFKLSLRFWDGDNFVVRPCKESELGKFGKKMDAFGDFVYDTFVLIIAIIKNKKQGSVICPLLVFDDPKA